MMIATDATHNAERYREQARRALELARRYPLETRTYHQLADALGRKAAVLDRIATEQESR